MCKNNNQQIIKFKETININQYINIDKINSLLIIGRTINLCGKFDFKHNDEYENEIPEFSIRESSENMVNNFQFLDTIINKHIEILIICDNEETEKYWNTVYTDYCIRHNIEEIKYNKYLIRIKVLKNESEYENIMNEINRKNLKFDVAILNPPYTRGIYEPLMENIFNIVNNEILWVGPTTWLLGKNQDIRFINTVNKYYTEIKNICASDYFDARAAQQLSITYINKNKNKELIYNNKKYNNTSDIKHYTHDNLLVSIFNKIGCNNLTENLGNHVYRGKNVHSFTGSKIIENPNLNWFCCKINRSAGDQDLTNRTQKNYLANIINKTGTYEENCGTYKELKNKIYKSTFKYYVAFETEQELKNFWKYIHTDFARICLYFIKINRELGGGELTYVPWQDFTEEWTDEKLFKKYNITEEEIKHIYEVLPNYHNIKRLY